MAYLFIKYVAYLRIKIICLIILSITNIIQSNALKGVDIEKPNIKSNIIDYLYILIILIGYKFS